MLSHRHRPEYSWLPDLCAQKLSLPGTPYPRLFDYKSWGTSVALMGVQAPRDCKVDKELKWQHCKIQFSHKLAYIGLLLIRKSLKSPWGISSSTIIVCEENIVKKKKHKSMQAKSSINVYCTHGFSHSDHSIQLDHVGMFKLSHDGCLLQKLDLVRFIWSWLQWFYGYFYSTSR